jgi:alkylation response protein AidB-like acyl-CoA dehydrogenase
MTSTTTLDRSPWTGSATPEEVARWTAVALAAGERLAAGALARDRDNASPGEALEILREAGLANLMIPAAYGGIGAHWETAFQELRILARADASLAQILGYSYLNEACISFYGSDPAARERWYRRSADASWFWSDSFNPVSPDLEFAAEGEGYRLSGLKRFATGASATDVVIAGAVADGGRYDGELVIFAIDTQREGIAHLGDWDNLGQRASASGSVRYDRVLVTEDDILGTDPGDPFSSLVTPGVQLLFGNIYLGIAEGALAQARELTRARPNSWFLSAVDRYADDPNIHRLFGGLVAKTAAVEALADRLNRRYDDAVALGERTTAEDRAAAEVQIAALKVVSTEVGLEVSSRVYEAAGASATKNAIGLDLYWRNLRTHSLHDPVDYKKIEVGAHFLNGTVQPISLYT